MQARDLMTLDVVPDASLHAIVRTLMGRDISAGPVVDESGARPVSAANTSTSAFPTASPICLGMASFEDHYLGMAYLTVGEPKQAWARLK